VGGRALPTGTLTFLFTDLEGSTRLLHEYADEYASLLETHRALIRDAVVKGGGVEFGTGGDALFVVFDSAPAAVTSAAAAQRALQSHVWPVPTTLKVRMALHTGEARVVDDDYVGLALHVVARLCNAGHGGQVLLSSSTYALTPDVDVLDLGLHELRDVAEPMHVFQLCEGDLARDFPALRTRSARPNNLPIALDRLIGRDLEAIEVVAALHNHRLVTLTGSGGSGKTRLALDVAASAVGDFVDGVWLLELGAVTTSDEVVALLAQTLRVGERVGFPLTKAVVEYLEGRNMLLLFDNCEHLIDAVAALVEETISHCPGVSVLATSRELIGIRGERAISLAPLSVGDVARPGPAMQLFIERVKESNADFVPSAEDVAVVAEICARLDGLPLAIELAAARTRSLALRQVADRLHDRFRLLTGGARTAVGRQRTLEAVVSWSYDLLDPVEQRLFRRLSVFPDSFSLEAAECVAADKRDVIELLGHLVDKSLVVAVPGEGYRYQFLETIRQYGRERLLEHDESVDTHAQLVDWILALTSRLEREMRTARQDAALRAVLPERANARAALEWSIERDDSLAALRILSAIPLMVTSQRRALLQDLLDRTPGVPDATRAQVLLTLANLALEQGDPDDMAEFTQEAAMLFDQLGDQRLSAWARYFEVFAMWADPAARSRANELAQRAMNTFQELGDDFGLAYALWAASQFAEDADAARETAERSVTLFRTLNAQFGLAHALEGRALIALNAGDDTNRVESWLAEALNVFADADNFGCTAHCLEAIAAVSAANGRLEDAACMLGAAQRLRDDVGQEHRAWELAGQTRTRQALERASNLEDIDRARAAGHSLSFAAAVERARHMLGPSGAAVNAEFGT
jgi:predicted ATPase/class 3 adenylate cyclase